MVKHAEGEGVGRRGSDIFLWGDRHFSNTDPLCIAPTQVCVWGEGGGVKIGLLLFGSF